jgi:hypothetical protein
MMCWNGERDRKTEKAKLPSPFTECPSLSTSLFICGLRRRPDSNRGIKVLQTSPLPLGYVASLKRHLNIHSNVPKCKYGPSGSTPLRQSSPFAGSQGTRCEGAPPLDMPHEYTERSLRFQYSHVLHGQCDTRRFARFKFYRYAPTDELVFEPHGTGRKPFGPSRCV